MLVFGPLLRKLVSRQWLSRIYSGRASGQNRPKRAQNDPAAERPRRARGAPASRPRPGVRRLIFCSPSTHEPHFCNEKSHFGVVALSFFLRPQRTKRTSEKFEVYLRLARLHFFFDLNARNQHSSSFRSLILCYGIDRNSLRRRIAFGSPSFRCFSLLGFFRHRHHHSRFWCVDRARGSQKVRSNFEF